MTKHSPKFSERDLFEYKPHQWLVDCGVMLPLSNKIKLNEKQTLEILRFGSGEIQLILKET